MTTPRLSPLVRSLCLLAVLGIGAYFLLRPPIHRFSGVAGPTSSTTLKALPATTIEAYSQGEPSRLAVLITDPDADWLGLVHGLKTRGIPFILTRDYRVALAHKVVLVYPTISGKLLERDALQALAAFPRAGGTLIGFEILGGGLEEVFGIRSSTPVRGLRELRFLDAGAQAFKLTAKEDLQLGLSGKNGSLGAYAFETSSGEVWARYDDERAAIVHRTFGTGQTLAIGLDIGAFLAKSYNGRLELDNDYINAYGANADVILRLLRTLYRAAEPLAVTIDTVPEGRPLSVIVTHDVDYTRSIQNAIRYAELERAQGVRSTYFIQAKYVRDWNDDIFFNEQGLALTNRLQTLGMEIASHSVSHSRVFSRFPLGDGEERYPTYVPFVKDKFTARNGTVLGELRVSRFLLEHAASEKPVVSFRPGHLQYPFNLPEALQATGYRFSSSVAAGMVHSHLPFRLNVGRQGNTETPIFEFPITIEDELARPMTARLPAALDILDKLKAYGGMCVVLIHPDVFEDKLAFLEALIPRAKEMGAWFGSIEDMGTWWVKRDDIQLDVSREQEKFVLSARSPLEFNQVAFEIPAGWQLDPQDPANRGLRQTGHKIVVEESRRSLRATFR